MAPKLGLVADKPFDVTKAMPKPQVAHIGRPLDVAQVYDQYADLVWRTLHRLGCRQRDLPDLMHEVFLVVHRRRGDFDGRPIQAWLRGICVGVIRNYHRGNRRRPLALPGALPELQATGTPETAALKQQKRDDGRRALESLDVDKRIVFLLFEVEGLSTAEVAELLELPIGTVHSRLHSARRELAKLLKEATHEQ